MSIVAVDREFEKDILHVDWFIGKRCNFDCDYCPDGLHDNYSPHYKFENTKKLIDTFLNKFGVMKSNPGKQINVAINQCHSRTCIIPKNDPIYNGSMTLK